MAVYQVEKLSALDLGRQGENLARTIEIDVTSILAKWPDAVITLLVKRKGDAEPYFANTIVEEGVLRWPITNVETAVVGDGKIEIQATWGDVIAKSVTATIRVSASLSGSAANEMPEVRPSWVDELLDRIGEGREVFAVTAVVGPDGYYISNRTQEEIRAAVAADKACIFICSDGQIATYYGDLRDGGNASGKCPTFMLPLEYAAATGLKYQYIQVQANQKYVTYSSSAWTPNPKALTFTGAATGSYNGSQAVTVNIPSLPEDERSFVVRMSDVTENQEGEMVSDPPTMDKPFSEVLAALQAGRSVVCLARFITSDGTQLMPGHCVGAFGYEKDGAVEYQAVGFAFLLLNRTVAYLADNTVFLDSI